ncbi:MAG: hypothetical protein GX050_07545 [Firmicutes bacterium]|nr:hypothetical protein [Bacillota bacterium]
MKKNHLLILLERLEEVLTKGPKLAGRSLIVLDEALELLEKIKLTLPAEVKEAQQLLAQKEKILQTAREEAEQVIQRSSKEAQRILSEHHLTRLAEEKANAIKEQAYSVARQAEKELALYAQEVLGKLEENLIEALKVVHRAKDSYAELEREEGERREEHD